MGIGKVHSSWFDNDMSLIKEPFPRYSMGIHKIRTRRNYSILVPEREGDYLLSTTGEDLKKSSFTERGDPSHSAISRKSQALMYLGQIEETMKAIHTDETMDLILRRY